eukprot:Colp12_sorted_trinity150504_noHs@27853
MATEEVGPTTTKLLHREKELVRIRIREIVKERCDPTVRAFAECTSKRSLSMLWGCRKEKENMQMCADFYLKDPAIFDKGVEFYEKSRDARDAARLAVEDLEAKFQ